MTFTDIELTETTLTVYTKEHCPQCDATQRTLDRMGLDYRSVPITEDNSALLQEAGFRQAPVVMVSVGSELTDCWSGYRPDKLRTLEGAVAR